MVKNAIGRGTKVFVAPASDAEDRVWPEETVFTVSGENALAVGAVSIPVTMAPAITRPIPASAARPFFLNFTEINGKSPLVLVTADILPGAETLTVAPLKKAINPGALAVFPLILGRRENADLSDDKTETDFNIFENTGYGDSQMTMIRKGLSCPGYYTELDAGFRTCMKAANDLDFQEVYIKLILPTPTGYNKGRSFEFFTGVMLPINTPATEMIKADMTFKSRGDIRMLEPS